MRDYDYYFAEEDTFEQAIEKLKEKIRQETLQEEEKTINLLKIENIELKDKMKNLTGLEEKYNRELEKLKLREDRIKEDLEKEFYNKKLSWLLEALFEIKPLYTVKKDLLAQEKCPYCDENRKIKLVDNAGRKYMVDCKCSNCKINYVAIKSCQNLYVQKAGKDLTFVLRTFNNDFFDTQITRIENGYLKLNNIYEKFDEKKPPKGTYDVFFTSVEECQKYVDYLNKLEEQKNGQEN